jgi:hypothetical protein
MNDNTKIGALIGIVLSIILFLTLIPVISNAVEMTDCEVCEVCEESYNVFLFDEDQSFGDLTGITENGISYFNIDLDTYNTITLLQNYFETNIWSVIETASLSLTYINGVKDVYGTLTYEDGDILVIYFSDVS